MNWDLLLVLLVVGAACAASGWSVAWAQRARPAQVDVDLAVIEAIADAVADRLLPVPLTLDTKLPPLTPRQAEAIAAQFVGDLRHRRPTVIVGGQECQVIFGSDGQS